MWRLAEAQLAWGSDKGWAQSPVSLSLPAKPQKPSQRASPSPTDVSLKPGVEAALSEHSDTSPLFTKEVILAAFTLLYSYFSSWQNRNKGYCLWEQAEKNSKLKTL